ncbi:MAG: hypothetical protein FGM23_05185, partial [Alphaproteobacteria bacterium]|nr:hypothetical protein [Alphaproteobacteria bacterium]
MKFFKSSAVPVNHPSCASHRAVKNWRSNRGYMFAMMLAMLALMAAMGVGLSRLLMTTKATTQMQRMQDNKQLMNSVVMTLSTKAVDGDSDNVLEAPAFSTAVVAGLTAPTNGGFVGTDVANTDAWGRRLGYCAYDYGSAAVTAATGTARIRGSTASSPTDSWVAIVVISAGPDGVINTPCPAVDTAASSVVATGDDMVAARSYSEMISFGNAQIASTLSALGTNTTNKLCRLNDSGKMVCDVLVTPNALCRVDSTGTPKCDMVATNKLCRFDSTGTPKCDVTYPTNGCSAGYYLTLNAGDPPSFQCAPGLSSQRSLRPFPLTIFCDESSQHNGTGPELYKGTENDTYIYVGQSLGPDSSYEIVYDSYTGALLHNSFPYP